MSTGLQFLMTRRQNLSLILPQLLFDAQKRLEHVCKAILSGKSIVNGNSLCSYYVRCYVMLGMGHLNVSSEQPCISTINFLI